MEHAYTTVSRFRRFIQSLGDERELRMALYSTSTAYTSLAVATPAKTASRCLLPRPRRPRRETV